MKRLAYLRRKSQITQEQLANKFNVSRTTIGHWETGKYIPDYYTIKKIAIYFGVTTDFLMGYGNDMIDQLSDPEQTLIQLIRTNNIKISEVLEYAKFKIGLNK